MEDNKMSRRHVWVLSLILAGAGLALASSAPVSAINTCIIKCTCVASCSETCLIGPVQDPDVLTCEEYGICISTPECDPGSEGCPAQNCTSTINGTSSGDTINGGSARECINGFGGGDTIDGNAGDDQIWAGDGTDTVFGDSGNDCLYGENDGDNLDGESGYDLADGGAGSDTCTAEIKTSCP